MTEQVAIVRRELDQGRTEIEQSLALIEGFVVENNDDQEFAAEIIQDVKAKHKALEVKRKAITVPMNTALKEVNNLFRPVREALEKGERILKGKIVAYQHEQTVKNAQALVEASEAETPQEAQVALAKTATVTSPKSVNVRYVWKATIEDESKLPREYLCPDMARIDLHASEAKEEPPAPIPGVSFKKAPIVSSRRT